MCVIHKYVHSYYAVRGVADSSAAQCLENLTRIFRIMNNHFGVVLKEDRIEGLTANVLDSFYGDLAKRTEMSTRNLYVCFLNPFLRWAFTRKVVDEDLSKILSTHRLPKQDSIPEWERKEKYVTAEQVDELLRVMPGRNKIRDRAIIALFLGTGLRVSELCSLTIGSMLRYEKGMLYCRRKGGEWKYVLVADFVYPYLEEYLATRKDRDEHDRPLFLTTHGHPANRNQIYKAIAFKQEALGLDTGVHNFRHTFISNVEKDGGAAVARDVANHTSLHVTNKYDHSTHEQREAAVRGLRLGTL